MRLPLAIVIAVGGIVSPHPTAEARQDRRGAQPPYHYSPPPSPNSREQALCEERAQNSDPAGR